MKLICGLRLGNCQFRTFVATESLKKIMKTKNLKSIRRRLCEKLLVKIYQVKLIGGAGAGGVKPA
jgi:hypothetical protein